MVSIKNLYVSFGTCYITDHLQISLEQVNFTDGSFTWPVEVIDSREGETYLYTFSTAYDYQNGHYTSYSGTLNFHVQAS